MTNSQVVVMVGSGFDSALILTMATIENGPENVYPVHIGTNTNRAREERVRNMSSLLATHAPAFIRPAYSLFVDTETLLHSDEIPFKLGIYFSVGIAYAALNSGDVLFFGGNLSDNRPETTPVGFGVLAAAGYLGTHLAVQPFAPASHMNELQVITAAHELGAPLEATWHCKRNFQRDDKHCGDCEGCHRRRAAFNLAMVRDPLNV